MLVLLIIILALGFVFIGSLVLLSCTVSVDYDRSSIEWRLNVVALYGDSSSRRRARHLEEELRNLDNLTPCRVVKKVRALRREADRLSDEVLKRA